MPHSAVRRLPFHTVDVFTDTPFRGNPLAIVEKADGLTTGQMQIIAREFNLSETIFVQAPGDPAHQARVRIFFPTAEIPFAGHPTIGCAIHLAFAKNPDADFETQIILEEEAGLVPVRVVSKGGKVTATLTAPVVPHSHDGVAPNAALAASALGLDPVEIGFDGHACAVHAGGPAFLYIPVSSVNILGKANVREPYWSQIIEDANVDSAYVYARGRDGCDFQARMFSPTAGIPEDPATGSATAILASQLLMAGELAEGTASFSLLQGVEMGRRSELGLEVECSGNGLKSVRISGTSVPISSGAISIPQMP